MPIFDDRFARQNRCEPPPEFPLASPYTGIVHLLSGPAPYALTQIHPRTSGSVDDAPKLSPAFTFITRRGLTPEHSHTKTTPWSVFQDGSLMTITPASLQKREPQSPPGYYTTGYNTPRGELHSRSLYPPAKTDAGLNWKSALGRTPDD
ncbi:Ff.00g115140.m01.CDS01 [Fusarium sp. VM40]|nr:Ff.00g034590.m01.CDS01 [Fusarium sp. VM40]CAJ0549848.1 Ff.00g034610.m01.CDS01 [Fusarium sp. VM40]CAJ0549851.1 Ff.00g034640.m01.CDS01 [Fusarium sp. VM40]CAJ0553002.1 Ff.00g115140.m01.CDS01 [Fusarium sp. VM40]